MSCLFARYHTGVVRKQKTQACCSRVTLGKGTPRGSGKVGRVELVSHLNCISAYLCWGNLLCVSFLVALCCWVPSWRFCSATWPVWYQNCSQAVLGILWLKYYWNWVSAENVCVDLVVGDYYISQHNSVKISWFPPAKLSEDFLMLKCFRAYEMSRPLIMYCSMWLMCCSDNWKSPDWFRVYVDVFAWLWFNRKWMKPFF